MRQYICRRAFHIITMNLNIGQVVKSTRGHDNNNYFVVVSISGNFVNIADGRSRSCSKPKKKNPAHLKPLNAIVELDTLTDKKVRQALHKYNFPESNINSIKEVNLCRKTT